MLSSAKVLSSLQQPPSSLAEGLPFWIFWFLLGIIALLLFFIFLRDKELRRRIDFFFLSARNRSLQLHLQRQMRRQKKKRELLWLEIGRVVWTKRLPVAGTEALFSVLDSLEKKKDQLLASLAPIRESRESLEKQLTSLSESPPGQLKEKTSDLPTTLSQPYSSSQLRDIRAEIRSKKRQEAKITDRIRDMEEHERVYLTTLGRIVDTLRCAFEELQQIYARIDEVNAEIGHLEQRLDSLRPF